MSYNKLKSLVANVEAIETAMKIQVQGRQATAEEKEILSRYSGFGGSAKRRNRSLELARNHRYVPSCIVSLLQPYRPLLAWSQQRIVPLHHPFPWQPFCAVPHTSLQFSSCGHWTVSLIWDWECSPCTLAIYSRTTTSHYQCSLSLLSGTVPLLPSQKT